MGKLVINQSLVNKDNAESITKLCPFGAISYENGGLSISAACKMCKLCAKKSGGIVTYEEETITEIDKSLWRGITVYADCQGGKIHKVTFELCGKAKELAKVTGHPIYAFLIGENIMEQASELLHYGVDKVFVYDDEAFRDFRIEPYAAAFSDFIEQIKPSSILVGATELGRQLAPRVAARFRAGLTADCTVLEMKENTDLVQIRPAFGGNIMAQIISPATRPQFCTVRYKIFDEPPRTEAPSGEIVQMSVTEEMKKSDIQVLKTDKKQTDVDISEADVIVALGRGAQTDALRAEAEELASLLGGMVACTRPLVESNLFDAKHQIGLSGRTVKPKFIICLGISGAVQFAAGMKSSATIVAINTDKSAPIFDVAHYCVVGDVAEILPRIIKNIKEAKNV